MIPSADDCTLDELELSLNASTTEERMDWMRSLGKKQMVRLYQAAEGRDVQPAFFLGEAGAALTWQGRNSLPAFSDFAKAFAEHGVVNDSAGVQKERIQGYNVNTGLALWFGGPGHFLVRICGQEHGEQLIFDYVWEVDSVPAGFPEPASNLRGTHKLVYGNMKDVVRRLSDDLIVSKAYRNGKAEGAYFCLCKRAV